MDKYIYNEQNELWYELQGDYYLPLSEIAGGRSCTHRHLGTTAPTLSQNPPQGAVYIPAHQWQVKWLSR